MEPDTEDKMPEISIATHLATDPAQAFAHVTAFPPSGTPDRRVLEERYGELLSQEGKDYTFQDKAGSGNRWLYTFEPPYTRRIQALDSNWSDRIDSFQPYGDGTVWTIRWEPREGGAPMLLRWLFFQLKDKKMLHAQLMQPVVEHFEKRDYY